MLAVGIAVALPVVASVCVVHASVKDRHDFLGMTGCACPPKAFDLGSSFFACDGLYSLHLELFGIVPSSDTSI